MSTNVTDTDLAELKDFLGKKFETLEAGQKDIENRLTKIETRLEDWKPAIDKIPDLAEKVGELKNWRQTAFIVITAFVTALVSGTIGYVIRGGSRLP